MDWVSYLNLFAMLFAGFTAYKFWHTMPRAAMLNLAMSGLNLVCLVSRFH